MKVNNCKNCGNIIPSNNSEICDDCKKSHDLSVFLKNLLDFLGTGVYFDENDFEKIGIDEFIGYEYIWDLSKLDLINLHEGKFFINKDMVDEFIKKYYLSQYVSSDEKLVFKIDDEQYEVYDSSKIKITNNPAYKKDILNLVKNIEFIEESSNIPFPQSDDLNRFIFIGQTLLKRDLSKEDIKQSNKIGDRIVNMYTSTGFYFHVFEKYRKDKIFYKLSDKGKSIFQLDEYQRNLKICQCIFEHKIFHDIFLMCFLKKEINKKDIVNVMLRYDLNLGSMVTIERRASCVSSWMHWIFRLMGMYF